MIHSDPSQPQTLGADLRALRKARGLTLSALGDVLGRSVGWLSQVERGMSEPGMEDLRLIARALDVSLSSLFRQNPGRVQEQDFIVRAQGRRPIGSRAAGLVEELLSPDLTDDFEVVHSTFMPHSRIRETVQRPTQEVGYLLAGTLEIEIDGTVHSLTEGDSFRIRGEPFRWANRSDREAVAIWVIAPPVY
ncbi:helix-turn-helix domain-containing protein [Sulfitobacter sp. S190]|uniref:helix-turn-helix domain-containing protein n=1 Tax=Sulfitobacter sp. S190 TaxID=2867022 RepID=UPI0021A7653B|nr:XRE family transcriptional regulator [Sulfitobacter sp. S190]UWR22225.1 XRE family transcriptional regulator [Sulfitobacter sp. S190]